MFTINNPSTTRKTSSHVSCYDRRLFVRAQSVLLFACLSYLIIANSTLQTQTVTNGETFRENFQETFPETFPKLMTTSKASISMSNYTCRFEGREQIEMCESIVQSRHEAETLWRKQNNSYLWMEHARKAGGTSLCMALRLNAHGLIQLRKKDHRAPPRETCQMCKFCCDCDLRKKPWYSIAALPGKVMEAMDSHERNFIEVENSGVPVNMLDDSSWGNFVFVSTLRHPIDRIVSLLLNDQCKKSQSCFEQRKASFVAEARTKCAKAVYFCTSNYYVRIFSGLDTRFTNDTHMLLTAKMNFLRFSCVVLVEYWEETSTCLERLGMHLKDSTVFNIGGNMKNNARKPVVESSRTKHLSDEELRLIQSLNQVDIEFYAWAKSQLLYMASSM